MSKFMWCVGSGSCQKFTSFSFEDHDGGLIQICSSHLIQLLLDTLEALKITYPKCLSGLSGNNTSSEQQVCHLNWTPFICTILSKSLLGTIHDKACSLSNRVYHKEVWFLYFWKTNRVWFTFERSSCRYKIAMQNAANWVTWALRSKQSQRARA